MWFMWLLVALYTFNACGAVLFETRPWSRVIGASSNIALAFGVIHYWGAR